MDRSDLELILAVQRQRSLAGAARTLDLAPSVVTKRLAAVEQRLGHRLFVRTTRRLDATAEGLEVCAHAQELLRGFRRLDAALEEHGSAPAGPLRIAATFGFGRRWLGPALADFQQRHGGLRIDLYLTEQLPDLQAEGFDGAVWLWQVPPARSAQWTSRRLARNRRVLAAAPAYLAQRGRPQTLDDLHVHDCLRVRENTAAGADVWTLQRAGAREARRVQVQGPLASNSGEMVRDWCLAGRGIMLRSLWDIAPQLADGSLEHVLPDYAMHDADIQWLAPWQPRTPRKLRLLVDFLAARFRGEPWKAAT
ncbi:LysR substrate-binding domain-containing protein [Xylophilus sp.]|uniref:LysR substrate-binding domain-containing protein n=1 Tax=Xylophilus sp. TaxID=2653893 RepID=UPI0013B6D5A3|nr:LysR substrate-binding domain-containing protein [Xylophilus sp.]KAF1042298.1 MAG: HTH-type transcriptional regulator DmlR [Xylophilus sp.]